MNGKQGSCRRCRRDQRAVRVDFCFCSGTELEGRCCVIRVPDCLCRDLGAFLPLNALCSSAIHYAAAGRPKSAGRGRRRGSDEKHNVALQAAERKLGQCGLCNALLSYAYLAAVPLPHLRIYACLISLSNILMIGVAHTQGEPNLGRT